MHEIHLWPSFFVERIVANDWVNIPLLHCSCDALCTSPSLYTLQPQEILELEWNQKEESCRKDFTLVSNTVLPGIYGIGMSVIIDEQSELEKKYIRQIFK